MYFHKKYAVAVYSVISSICLSGFFAEDYGTVKMSAGLQNGSISFGIRTAQHMPNKTVLQKSVKYAWDSMESMVVIPVYGINFDLSMGRELLKVGISFLSMEGFSNGYILGLGTARINKAGAALSAVQVVGQAPPQTIPMIFRFASRFSTGYVSSCRAIEFKFGMNYKSNALRTLVYALAGTTSDTSSIKDKINDWSILAPTLFRVAFTDTRDVVSAFKREPFDINDYTFNGHRENCYIIFDTISCTTQYVGIGCNVCTGQDHLEFSVGFNVAVGPSTIKIIKVLLDLGVEKKDDSYKYHLDTSKEDIISNIKLAFVSSIYISINISIFKDSFLSLNCNISSRGSINQVCASSIFASDVKVPFLGLNVLRTMLSFSFTKIM